METQIKIVVRKHSDGYVAHARGMDGVVVGQGDAYEEALADVRSAIAFHKQEFANEAVVNPEEPPAIRTSGDEPSISLL